MRDKEVEAHLDKITDYWGTGEYTKFAYEIALLYSSGDMFLVSSVMEEFEEWIGTLHMCNGCN